MLTLLRRTFWLAAIGAAGFVGWSAWGRRKASVTAGPPEWPPIEPPAHASSVGATAEAGSDDPTPADSAVSGAGVASPSETGQQPLRWVAPEGGACPSTHPLKANSNSGIFHVPGGRFYNQTRAERCYALAEDAEADGYRRAKS